MNGKLLEEIVTRFGISLVEMYALSFIIKVKKCMRQGENESRSREIVSQNKI